MALEQRGSSAKKPEPFKAGENKMDQLSRKLFGDDQPKTPAEAQDRLEEAVKSGKTTPDELLRALEDALGDNTAAITAATDMARVTKLAYDASRNPAKEAEYKEALVELVKTAPPQQLALMLGMGVQAMLQLAYKRGK